MNIDDLRKDIEKYGAGAVVKDTDTKKDIIEQLQTLYLVHAETLANLEKQLFENRRLRGVILNRVDK